MAFYKHTVSVLDGSDNAFTDREIVGKKFSFPNNSSPGPIGSVNITQEGSYASLPTLSVSGNGSGAVLQPRMKALSATLANAGTGYTVGNSLTVTGVTGDTPVTISVNSIGPGGAIATFTITSIGTNLTVIPANPAGVSGGSGTGATFNMLWALMAPIVSAGGSGYDNTSALTITGGGSTGGGAGTLVIPVTSNPVTVPVSFTDLPTKYGVFVNPGQNCNWHVLQSGKTNSGFNVVLTPASSSTITVGNIDVYISA